MTGTTPRTTLRTARRTVLLATGGTAPAAGRRLRRERGGGGDGSSPDTASDTAAPEGSAGRDLATTDDIPVGGACSSRTRRWW
ncbi:hypothetical protein SHIRM173S_06534 [Streptomyces hirsutus]